MLTVRLLLLLAGLAALPLRGDIPSPVAPPRHDAMMWRWGLVTLSAVGAASIVVVVRKRRGRVPPA